MSSSRALDRLAEIIDNCDSILAYVGDMDFVAYSADRKTKDAAERCFQRISEASCKLGGYLDVLYPGIDWKGTRGVGNLPRH